MYWVHQTKHQMSNCHLPAQSNLFVLAAPYVPQIHAVRSRGVLVRVKRLYAQNFLYDWSLRYRTPTKGQRRPLYARAHSLPALTDDGPPSCPVGVKRGVNRSHRIEANAYSSTTSERTRFRTLCPQQEHLLLLACAMVAAVRYL